ncbi:transposase [Desulfosporosinus sp. SB140]|uniref:transposase n=1 Tax=Desulfosporosinus paludis TaxID=3115649 RepID=UPI003890D17D
MSRKSKYTAVEKYKILMEYADGISTIREITNKYDINDDTYFIWRYNFDKYGLNGLRESKTSKKYSKELMDQTVSDYLSGDYSLKKLACDPNC